MKQPDPPLTPNACYILLALAAGKSHGYAIMRAVRDLSDGAVRMGPATLYTSIQRLLDHGLIEEVSCPDDSDTRRRYYRLTARGGSALQAELSRMEATLRKAKAMRAKPAESES